MRADAGLVIPRACCLEVVSARGTEFIDITDRLSALVRDVGLEHGFLIAQTLHTTTGLLVNEAEPLLLEDLTARLACWAPLDLPYAHDDLSRRAVTPLGSRERRNGHAHCRAAIFRSSEMLIVEDGRLRLGRWQRVLFAECDGPQRRTLAVLPVRLDDGPRDRWPCNGPGGPIR
jgi:secondary thiamine-phosphate synthase enzyme